MGKTRFIRRVEEERYVLAHPTVPFLQVAAGVTAVHAVAFRYWPSPRFIGIVVAIDGFAVQ